MGFILGQPEFAHQNWVSPDRVTSFESTHTLKTRRLNVYWAPDQADAKHCGNLDTRKYPGSLIKVLEQKNYKNGKGVNRRWARVEIPDYASYAQLKDSFQCSDNRFYILSESLVPVTMDYKSGQN